MPTPKKQRKGRVAPLKTKVGHAVNDYSPALPAVINARTPAEAAVVAAHEAATKDRTQRAPTMYAREEDGGLVALTNDVALWRARMAEAVGIRDLEAQMHLISQVARVFWGGAADTNANAAIALIREIAPRNAAEALLVAQMVAVHNAAMELLRRAILPSQSADVIDMLSNRAARLVRLYVDQLAALERLRGGGARQTVSVERVTVEAGGQAVVGVVAPTSGGALAAPAWQERAAPDG